LPAFVAFVALGCWGNLDGKASRDKGSRGLAKFPASDQISIED